MTLPAFDYLRDDARRQIRIRPRRDLRAADYIDILGRQASEGTWGYGSIYDARTISSALSADELAAIAVSVKEHQQRLGRRGPVAVVTRDRSIIGASQIYSQQDTDVEMEVFWDLPEAQEWLDVVIERRQK